MAKKKERSGKPLRSSGIFTFVSLRLKLTSGVLSTVGVIMAAIVLSSDFTWVYNHKPYNIEGQVFRDLDQDGSQDPQDLQMGSIRFMAYRDLNDNGIVDKEDALLDQTLSDASGKFSFELPYLNRAEVKADIYDSRNSWSVEDELSLTFSDIDVQHIKNVKEIKLEVIAKENNSQFASTNILLEDGRGKVVRWDHKPWKKGRQYKSPNLKQPLKLFFDQSKEKKEIRIRLKFSEGSAPREVMSDIRLKIDYENKENPYLIAYESSYDDSGLPQYKLVEIDPETNSELAVPYLGQPAQCLSVAKNGSLYQVNRFTREGFSLPVRINRISSEMPTLLSDPVSGSWFIIQQGKIQILDAAQELVEEKELVLPFCLEPKTCISAYGYHPLLDELWVLDHELQLWKISINRNNEDIQLSNPSLIANWNEAGTSLPTRVDRMVIDPETDVIHFLSKQKEGELHLNRINKDGKDYRPLGPMVYGGKILKNILGLEFKPQGELWVIHLDKEKGKQEIYKVEPQFQLLSLLSSVQVKEDFKSCACRTSAPYKLTAKIFDDTNLNERIDEGERLLRNVRIIAKSLNQEKEMSMTASNKGIYTFRTYKKGMTEFVVDRQTLPEGILSTSFHSLIIPHDKGLPGNWLEGNDFPVSHISKSPSIKWAGIRGKLSEGGIELEWATAREEDSHFFEVLRSEDGINYEAVGGIEAVGNSDQMQEYKYKDYLIDDLETPIVAYRIKMKGGLGKISYSPVTQIVVSKPSDGLDLKVHVHPSNESVKMTYQVLKAGPSELRVMNLTGNVMTSMPVEMNQIGAEKEIPVKGWAKGMYYAQLRNGENSVMVRWILK